MAKANRRDVPFDWLIFIFRPARTFPCREHIIDETLWFSWVCGFPKLAYKLISTGDFLCWACSRVIFFAIFLSPFGAQCVLLCPSTRWWSWTVPPTPSHTDRSGSGRIHKGLRWRCTEDWMKQDWHIPLVSCVLLEMMPRCGPLRSIGTKSSLPLARKVVETAENPNGSVQRIFAFHTGWSTREEAEFGDCRARGRKARVLLFHHQWHHHFDEVKLEKWFRWRPLKPLSGCRTHSTGVARKSKYSRECVRHALLVRTIFLSLPLRWLSLIYFYALMTAADCWVHMISDVLVWHMQ